MPQHHAARVDRAVGALLGTAAGDALGAGYEFHPAVPARESIAMGGGPNDLGWSPGEWTDDTSMAIPIARLASQGAHFDDAAVLGRLVANWREWARSARDVGVQTRRVLADLAAPTEEAARASALAVHEAEGRSGGNGSLMRTAPLAAAYLDDPAGLAGIARRVSELTHAEADAGDACVIWTLAIRHAIVTGELEVHAGIDMLDPERRERWHDLLDEAAAKTPADFPKNGWVVHAIQGALSAVVAGRGFADTVERAVRAGGDTDTVAAIAGALAGARLGASAIPAGWRRMLHGWPGMTTRQLMEFAVLAANGGRADAEGWPRVARLESGTADVLVRHPHDDGVVLASLRALDRLPSEIDAVVSLSRVGSSQTERETIEFWLIDEDDENADLGLVLRDAADAIAMLRREGKAVAVHCVNAVSRTPAVAAVYAVRHLGVGPSTALDRVVAAMPGAAPRRELVDAVLAAGGG